MPFTTQIFEYIQKKNCMNLFLSRLDEILHFIIVWFSMLCALSFEPPSLSISKQMVSYTVALVMPLPNPADPKQHEACCVYCKNDFFLLSCSCIHGCIVFIHVSCVTRIMLCWIVRRLFTCVVFTFFFHEQSTLFRLHHKYSITLGFSLLVFSLIRSHLHR